MITYKRLVETGGWIGILLIQGATLPTTIPVLLGGNTDLPPLSMVLMVWAGLMLFLLRAIEQRDRLYIVSNGVGFALQTVLLAIIVYR